MNDEAVAGAEAVLSILRDLEEAQQRFMAVVAEVTDAEFAWQPPDGDPIKRTLEKAADEVNFRHGRLVARMRGLAPTACIPSAEFLSIREAVVALQVAHRRLSNLLHDLRAEDLERSIAGEEESQPVSLRSVLAMAAEHYRQRAQQVERLRAACAEAKR